MKTKMIFASFVMMFVLIVEFSITINAQQTICGFYCPPNTACEITDTNTELSGNVTTTSSEWGGLDADDYNYIRIYNPSHAVTPVKDFYVIAVAVNNSQNYLIDSTDVNGRFTLRGLDTCTDYDVYPYYQYITGAISSSSPSSQRAGTFRIWDTTNVNFSVTF